MIRLIGLTCFFKWYTLLFPLKFLLTKAESGLELGLGSGSCDEVFFGGSSSCDTGPAAFDKNGVPATQSCISITTVSKESSNNKRETQTRCWYTYIPEGVKSKQGINGAPLIVDLHGLCSCALWQSQMSGWKEKADENGIIVVWPDGNQDPRFTDYSCWDAGFCCCSKDKRNINIHTVGDDADIYFLVQLISDTAKHVQESANVEINRKRIYLTGHSNGAFMTQRMLAEKSKLFAGVASFAGHYSGSTSFWSGNLPYSFNYSPSPLITFIGDKDDIIDFDGCFGSMSAHEKWASLNGCCAYELVSDDIQSYHRHIRSSCNDDAEVQLVQLFGVDHTPYKNSNSSVDTTQIAWEFLSKYELITDAALPPCSSCKGEIKPQISSTSSSSSTSTSTTSSPSVNVVSDETILDVENSLPHVNNQETPSSISPELTSSSTSQNFCKDSYSFVGQNLAGYECRDNDGNIIGDSNTGGIKTQSECLSQYGTFETYTCLDVNEYWLSKGDMSLEFIDAIWHEKCCPSVVNDDSATGSNGIHTDMTSTQELVDSDTHPAPSPPKTGGPFTLPQNIHFCPDTASGFFDENIAGYFCEAQDGSSIFDSNFGGTEKSCSEKEGAQWKMYSCHDAANYWTRAGGSTYMYDSLLKSVWSPKCCDGYSHDFCATVDSVLVPYNSAGHVCQSTESGEPLGESNEGYSKVECASIGGIWTEYVCADVQIHWESVGGETWDMASYFKESWGPGCCNQEESLLCPDESSPLLTFEKAGDVCFDSNGDVVSDSNFGGSIVSCLLHHGASWISYNCIDAENYYKKLLTSNVSGEHSQFLDIYKSAWASKCCFNYAYPFCDGGRNLVPLNEAGYSCVLGGQSLGDSNLGFTKEECDKNNGDWVNYLCADVQKFWYQVEGEKWEHSDWGKMKWNQACCK